MTFTTASANNKSPFLQHRLLQFYLISFFIVWIYTFIGTTNYANWWTENALTIGFLILLITTHKKFAFSDLSYTLLWIYILLHIYGAMYTYAENPFGYWLKDVLTLKRNHYDRIVHFSFGLLLAYPMRDYFFNWFKWPVWVCWVLPVEITMSFSGLYEIIEYLVADVFFPSEGVAYLGTQGDVWDAQKDMALACSGAIVAMVFSSTLKRAIGKN
jgi:putative membrane protein